MSSSLLFFFVCVFTFVFIVLAMLRGGVCVNFVNHTNNFL